MHGPDFLDVADDPQMVFQSTSITEVGLGLHPGGQPHHQWGDPTGDVQHDVQRFAGLPHGSVHALRFIAGATISRSAFEVSYGVPMVADEVVLQLEAQFIKPAPTG
jgi:polyisoprenoid-binding protein YceI